MRAEVADDRAMAGVSLLVLQPGAGRAATCACCKGSGQAKFWLADCSLAKSVGFPDHELTRIARKVRRDRELFLRAWNDFLGRTKRTVAIADVRFDDERMYVLLQDGREIAVPLWWYPRLLRATSEQRNNWQILPFGDALYWPDLDEDLDVHGFLIGAKAPDAKPPVEA